MAVVSGSGQFDVDGRAVQGQSNYYALGSARRGEGRLIQQCFYVTTSRRGEFEASLALLGNELHKAFIEAASA